MNNYENLKERRRYQRIASDVPLQYKNIRDFNTSQKGSLSRNICAGGVCFMSDEFISLACRLVLEINLPSVPKPIKAISKVAWIRKTSADRYELGNQFLEITKEDKEHILNFVTKTLKTSL